MVLRPAVEDLCERSGLPATCGQVLLQHEHQHDVAFRSEVSDILGDDSPAFRPGGCRHLGVVGRSKARPQRRESPYDRRCRAAAWLWPSGTSHRSGKLSRQQRLTLPRRPAVLLRHGPVAVDPLPDFIRILGGVVDSDANGPWM
jgi:hypothetical protein